MAKAKFEMSRTFERDVRKSTALGEALVETAAPILARAKATAPVGDPDTDPHSGEYRDGLHLEVTPGPNGKEVRVVAGAPDSVYVEFGNEKIEAHATLRRAARG